MTTTIITGRRWQCYAAPKQRPVPAIADLADQFERRFGIRPRVVLAHASAVHQREDGIIVRVPGEHEPTVRSGEYYVEV